MQTVNQYPLRRLIWRGTETLTAAGIDNAAREAGWIAEYTLNITASDLLTDPERPVSGRAYLSMIRRRAKGEPLQYLLGSQNFMGMDLKVGRGVLIPRPETGLLCQVAADHLPSTKPVVLDLCAGSGAVSLGISRLKPDAVIYSVEKYVAAYRYLEQNLALFGPWIRPVRADIMTSALGELPQADLIVSNPPYIEREQLASLQKEVRMEPSAALDGGADGLAFYRRIAALTAGLLKPGGAVAVEIGSGQANAVKEIFDRAGLSNLVVYQDEAGLDRVVYATIGTND